MSQTVILPVQDVYSVSDLVKYLGYTRQSIAKAIREVCPNAEKGTKGYRLTADNARAIAANFSIVVEIEKEPRAKEEKQNQKQIEEYEKLIELLKEQIKFKDAQITALNERLASTDEQNAKLIEVVSDLTDTSKALATNATMHTAKDIKQGQEPDEPLSIVPQNQNKTFLQKLRELFS